ncbi:hypothetical protein [Geomonas ferrireducens]|uniref:hypothetical protein n=1 Tax=Geomonas ferrireducens TaxID=2570227 RepID=UPI0010A84114|nr:hypothetical protein [Geomonas ferrireducens]
MKKSEETRAALESALDRILAGSAKRNVSVSAVEKEAGLGNGSAYYYKDFVDKVKMHKKQIFRVDALTRGKPGKNSDRRIKEKYRDELVKLRKMMSKMAQTHHEMHTALVIALNDVADLKDKLAKARRSEIAVIKD